MFNRLFPRSIDNGYHGGWMALVFFLPVLAMKAIIGVNIAGLNPYVTTERILKSADGVPLDALAGGRYRPGRLLFGCLGRRDVDVVPSGRPRARSLPRHDAARLPSVFCRAGVAQMARDGQDQLQALSDEVGDGRSLLVMCSAFRGKADKYSNLTIKKIPKTVLSRCEWGHDDYSLKIENLSKAPIPLGQMELIGKETKS